MAVFDFDVCLMQSPHAFNNEYFQHLIRVEGEHYRPHLGLRVNRQDKKTVWEDSDGVW